MKKIRLHLIYFALSAISLISCESKYYDYRLKILNNSNNYIYADFYRSYPDTTLSINSHFGGLDHKVSPNGEITLARGGSWERAFQDDIQQKLLIFIFDAKIIENIPWDTIRNKYLVLKRYELTLKDLDSLNFKVSYP
jgi:hypothetical protein